MPRPACVLFGFADAIGVNLQSHGLPSQLTDIAPYVATLLALVISRRRRIRASPRSRQSAPAKEGKGQRIAIDEFATA